MYPVSLGLDEALKRIDKLLTNGHSAEALLTAVFTLEKTMRRSLQLHRTPIASALGRALAH